MSKYRIKHIWKSNRGKTYCRYVHKNNGFFQFLKEDKASIYDSYEEATEIARQYIEALSDDVDDDDEIIVEVLTGSGWIEPSFITSVNELNDI